MKGLYPLGTRRFDVLCRAKRDLLEGVAVVAYKKPAFSVRPARNRKERVFGVTLHAANRHDDVWVRVEGPAAVRIIDKLTSVRLA